MIELDVLNEAGVAAALAEMPAPWRALDILVNNAGATWGEPLTNPPSSLETNRTSSNVMAWPSGSERWSTETTLPGSTRS